LIAGTRWAPDTKTLTLNMDETIGELLDKQFSMRSVLHQGEQETNYFLNFLFENKENKCEF
jgi:hypothetical protein